ncbi:hypothetical protein QBC41DRAFT_303397 [Cercophora samala]|uniref:Uncharacterized protein n=1 Tax=Cercophora samala TaxID=330535 RepID=A0AA40DCC1_9PEZI|nr:hypothetical protein QBC41DRAFT_303397 [Cercophora samala]
MPTPDRTSPSPSKKRKLSPPSPSPRQNNGTPDINITAVATAAEDVNPTTATTNENRQNAFQALINFYTDGDLYDEDRTRRPYSLPPPPGSTPLEKMLWAAFLARVEEQDDQLVEYMGFHREYRAQIHELEEQREKDKRRMGELASRVGELMGRLRGERVREEGRVGGLEGRVRELEGEVDRLRGEVAGLKIREGRGGELRVVVGGMAVEVEPEEGGVVVVDKRVVEIMRETFGMDLG